MITQELVRDALRNVIDPELGMNVVDLGMIREITIDDGIVHVSMVLTIPSCPLAGFLVLQAQQAIEALPEVQQAEVTLLDEVWQPPETWTTF